ncbi:neuronal acetylcholine receptor subunit alpha-10-like [Lineus longissimus]|uniref:neuronal acetylcholine receptor subunit alpha-10-like n=1 Tax=Lineus longissimus TaxID=88925 RepID=UPI00315D85E6
MMKPRLGVAIALVMGMNMIGIGVQSLTTRAAPLTSEERLAKDLLDGYTGIGRPIANHSHAIEVGIYTFVLQIVELDDRRQTFVFSGIIYMAWRDAHLRWYPNEYDGLEQISLPIQSLWYPDIGVQNSADTLTSAITENRKNKAIVRFTGDVYWTLPGVYSVSCRLKMAMFPFDTQTVDIKVFVAGEVGEGVKLTTKTVSPFKFKYYSNSTEWNMVGIEHIIQRDTAFVSSVSFYLYTTSVTLKRRSGYYVFQILAPCVMISFLVTVTFYIPPESGEKVSFSVTIFLAFTVYQLMIADIVPKSAGSDQTPLITLYLTSLIAMSAAAVFLAILILTIYHHDPGKPVPKWMTSLIFGCLATITLKRQAVRNLGLKSNNTVETTVHSISSSQRKQEDSKLERSPGRNVPTGDIGLAFPTEEKLEALEDRRHAPAWKMAATILDRFFFMTFLCFAFCCNFVFFGIVPYVYV